MKLTKPRGRDNKTKVKDFVNYFLIRTHSLSTSEVQQKLNMRICSIQVIKLLSLVRKDIVDGKILECLDL